MLFQYRVRPVARRLDKDVPGWHRKVDLDRLNMMDNYNCVLGQVYGSYRNAPVHIQRSRSIVGAILFKDWHPVPLVFAREDGWQKAIHRRMRRDARRAARELRQPKPLNGAQVKLLELVYRSERNQVQVQPEPRYEEVLPG